jgi:hypothetical protein
MKNLLLLAIIVSICIFSGLKGTTKTTTEIKQKEQTHQLTTVIPNIGSVQLLNGCGAEGAATKVADYLRSNNFDVKYVGNADTWNYPATMVISRIQDTSIATQIARALKTDKMVMIRNNDNSYDVTVVIGPDFGERIQ